MGCPAIDIANPKRASRAIPAPARRASARGPVSLRRTKEKPRRYGRRTGLNRSNGVNTA